MDYLVQANIGRYYYGHAIVLVQGNRHPPANVLLFLLAQGYYAHLLMLLIHLNLIVVPPGFAVQLNFVFARWKGSKWIRFGELRIFNRAEF